MRRNPLIDVAARAAPARAVTAMLADPICVVDDDAWICDSLTALLEAYGFAVLAFASGREFLADERHRRAGCLIIDHHMPDMKGLEVIAALQREGTAVPTILITGRMEGGIRERAAELGVIAVVEKPFGVAQLVELIRSAMRGCG